MLKYDPSYLVGESHPYDRASDSVFFFCPCVRLRWNWWARMTRTKGTRIFLLPICIHMRWLHTNWNFVIWTPMSYSRNFSLTSTDYNDRDAQTFASLQGFHESTYSKLFAFHHPIHHTGSACNVWTCRYTLIVHHLSVPVSLSISSNQLLPECRQHRRRWFPPWSQWILRWSEQYRRQTSEKSLFVIVWTPTSPEQPRTEEWYTAWNIFPKLNIISLLKYMKRGAAPSENSIDTVWITWNAVRNPNTSACQGVESDVRLTERLGTSDLSPCSVFNIPGVEFRNIMDHIRRVERVHLKSDMCEICECT